MKIPINQLKTCPINSEIYRDSDVGDLVNSIGEVGLLQPLVVTPDNTIISGHRRFKAIQSLGWTEVEVEVKEVDDDSIPLYVVLFNQSRNKVASELIREIMVLMDSRWIGQGNWNRGEMLQSSIVSNRLKLRPGGTSADLSPLSGPGDCIKERKNFYFQCENELEDDE